jgi:iron complex transport system permease protein
MKKVSAGAALWIGGLSLALGLSMLVGVSLGETSLSWSQVSGSLLHAAGLGSGPTDPVAYAIVVQLRLPQVLCGALVGGALALAGALLQGLFRNPLAAPSLVGVTAGGAFGAVLAYHLGLAASFLMAVPASAFVGALVVSFVVYVLSTRGGETHIPTLLLTGIAFTALVGAATAAVLALSLRSWGVAREIIFWSLGGLEDRRWEHVLMVLPAVVVGSGGGLLYSKELNILALGERQAASMGVETAAVKRNVLALAALATGAAVAAAGIIGFVGLVVPHLLRLLIGPDHRRLLPVSFLGGAVFVVGMDILHRTVIRGLLAAPELRLGVLTGLVGAPFFIYLLIKQGMGENLG